MRFTVTLEDAEEGGYVVQCVEIPGAISEGETIAEAMANIQSAIADILAVRRKKARKPSGTRRKRLKTVEVDA